MEMNMGRKEEDRANVAEGLSKMLADTYTLYLKTHNFHWNVTGPMFQTLHLLFETQYNELALAVDLIAERIRALGFPAPGTYSEFAKLGSIKETQGVPKAEEMIRLLVEGQEAVVRTARAAFPATLLDRLRLRRCTSCGVDHARPRCPDCDRQVGLAATFGDAAAPWATKSVPATRPREASVAS